MSDAIGGEEDEAVQAFEALRAEVANLRRGIELVYQQGQEARSVDYSLTLGEMAQTLQGLQGRLAAIEGKPALAVTPAVYREQIAAAARLAAEVAGRALGEGTSAQSAATRALREVTGQVREAHEQRRSLVMAGAIGVLAACRSGVAGRWVRRCRWDGRQVQVGRSSPSLGRFGAPARAPMVRIVLSQPRYWR